MIIELRPVDGKKSFYNKAMIDRKADGTETLYSYGTRIMKKDTNGKLYRVWDGWTATTGRHIKAYCGLDKKGFNTLPYEV